MTQQGDGGREALRDREVDRLRRIEAAARTELRDEVRRLCPDCRSSRQAATLSGYTCPVHYEMFNGKPMPTLGGKS